MADPMSDEGAHDPVRARYLGDAYKAHNPSWDEQDSPWKADLVRGMLQRHAVRPRRIVEIGCGAGGVLAALREAFPAAELSGFDIAPTAAEFWPRHATKGIRFTVGDFLASTHEGFDVVLLLDVVEHLANPFEFLARVRPRGRHFVFHFPLDLSALGVLRETPLLHAREKVGHLHYYTRSLALALLEECGYRVVEARYTGAAFTAPQRAWATRLAGVVRRAAFAVHHDLGARLLGGETLMVLATPRDVS